MVADAVVVVVDCFEEKVVGSKKWVVGPMLLLKLLVVVKGEGIAVDVVVVVAHLPHFAMLHPHLAVEIWAVDIARAFELGVVDLVGSWIGNIEDTIGSMADC